MNKFFVIIIVTFILFPIGYASALSDADYKKFVKESPEFAQADASLNAIWKKIKSTLPGNQYKQILTEQRAWLEQRDQLVESPMNEKKSPVEIYSMDTELRAKELEARFFKIAPLNKDILGEYEQHNAEASIQAKGDHYSIEIHSHSNLADREYVNVCDYSGEAWLYGDILTVHNSENIVRIRVKGNTIEIGFDLNAAPNAGCGLNAGINGVYIKK